MTQKHTIGVRVAFDLDTTELPPGSYNPASGEVLDGAALRAAVAQRLGRPWQKLRDRYGARLGIEYVVSDARRR